jgi:hypothetical protein
VAAAKADVQRSRLNDKTHVSSGEVTDVRILLCCYIALRDSCLRLKNSISSMYVTNVRCVEFSQTWELDMLLGSESHKA